MFVSTGICYLLLSKQITTNVASRTNSCLLHHSSVGQVCVHVAWLILCFVLYRLNSRWQQGSFLPGGSGDEHMSRLIQVIDRKFCAAVDQNFLFPHLSDSRLLEATHIPCLLSSIFKASNSGSSSYHTFNLSNIAFWLMSFLPSSLQKFFSGTLPSVASEFPHLLVLIYTQLNLRRVPFSHLWNSPFLPLFVYISFFCFSFHRIPTNFGLPRVPNNILLTWIRCGGGGFQVREVNQHYLK